MDFYNDPKKVEEYEKMCEDYDGTDLYKVLYKHLKDNSTLLEIGCGPGNDIANLQSKYTITGSDLSDEFIRLCKNKYPQIDFLKLDAIEIDTNEKYDCIFSNKVLHHITKPELEKSFKRQQSVIKENGLFAHTFWLGEKEFTMKGMLFVFHTREKLLELVSKYFTVIETYEYKEFEDGDSLFVLAKNDKITTK